MQHPVPQFIEREQKLIGPLTIRQSIVLGIDATILVILFFLLDSFFIFTLVAVLMVSAGLVLAFGKFNERPMTDMIFSLFGFFLKPRIYRWKRAAKSREEIEAQLQEQQEKQEPQQQTQPEQEQNAPEEEKIEELAEFLDK